jgi:hypothetical protein
MNPKKMHQMMKATRNWRNEMKQSTTRIKRVELNKGLGYSEVEERVEALLAECLVAPQLTQQSAKVCSREATWHGYSGLC